MLEPQCGMDALLFLLSSVEKLCQALKEVLELEKRCYVSNGLSFLLVYFFIHEESSWRFFFFFWSF